MIAVPSAAPSPQPAVPATSSPGASAASPLREAPEPPRCSLREELENPFNPAVLGGDAAAWSKRVRERLLPVEESEEFVAASAWRAVEALASGDFRELSKQVGPEGLCLRASKGAECLQLSRAEVARCGTERKKHDWAIDSGEDGPTLLTCSEAVRKIFLRPNIRRPSRVTHNCFPEPGRGNNSQSVVLRPARSFVEFHVAGTSWLSLWLVFDDPPQPPAADSCAGTACDERTQLILVELIAEYWGP
ncbi:MAG TPA: hypothetical protein VGK73_22210 [Polyangiaceae bacterium]